jgi:hypothetical protein
MFIRFDVPALRPVKIPSAQTVSTLTTTPRTCASSPPIVRKSTAGELGALVAMCLSGAKYVAATLLCSSAIRTVENPFHGDPPGYRA